MTGRIHGGPKQGASRGPPAERLEAVVRVFHVYALAGVLADAAERPRTRHWVMAAPDRTTGRLSSLGAFAVLILLGWARLVDALEAASSWTITSAAAHGAPAAGTGMAGAAPTLPARIHFLQARHRAASAESQFAAMRTTIDEERDSYQREPPGDSRRDPGG